MKRLLQGRASFAALTAALVLLLLWPLVPVARAQALGVPYEHHVPLLLKLLSKSRSLPERLGQEVVIAVSGRRSLVEVQDIVRGKQLLGRSIRVVPFGNGKTAADIVYVGPDTRVPVSRICKMAKARGVATVTGVPDFVRAGVALGVKLSPSRRPKIMVNLKAAREEGIDLPSAILKIAEVVE